MDSTERAVGKRVAPVLIGDLLVKSELINLGQLADALPISQKTGLPVGRVLIGSGFINEERLHAALMAQSLIRDKLLTVEYAVLALKLIGQRPMSLEQALKEVGWRAEYFEFTNKLGQLLLDAGVVEMEQLEDGLQTCFNTGLPLGRVLVLKGVLSDVTAYAALTAQMLLRQGKITRGQALEGLCLSAQRKTTLEESLALHGYMKLSTTNSVRLGELLVLSELVSEIDLLTAVERGLVDELPIGQVLIQAKLISYSTLVDALKVQELVCARILNPLEAAEVLKLTRARGITIPQAVSEVTKRAQAGRDPELTMLDLLKMVRLIPNEDMEVALNESERSGAPVENILLSRKIIDPDTLQVALRCHKLLSDGYISAEQAVFALHYYVWSREDFEEIMTKLGWVTPR
ncbi:MAG TPA: hypothetical protein V6D17_04395 [Candidatus Obscuribacterales bacterium]